MEVYFNYPETDCLLIPMQNEDFSYHAHLHNCLEISFCTEGEVFVTVDNIPFPLQAGIGIVIPQNAIHRYETRSHSRFATFLVGLDALEELSRQLHHKKPERLTFPIDGLCCRLLERVFTSRQQSFAAKALLYRVCDIFTEENTFTDRESAQQQLCVQIMERIRKDFQQDITLQDIAKQTGYSYHYISKLVRQQFGVPFTTLLARYRVAYACNLLDKTTSSISQVALTAGFGSVRSFNRVFRDLTGCTPSTYCKRNRKEIAL